MQAASSIVSVHHSSSSDPSCSVNSDVPFEVSDQDTAISPGRRETAVASQRADVVQDSCDCLTLNQKVPSRRGFCEHWLTREGPDASHAFGKKWATHGSGQTGAGCCSPAGTASDCGHGTGDKLLSAASLLESCCRGQCFWRWAARRLCSAVGGVGKSNDARGECPPLLISGGARESQRLNQGTDTQR